jgi:hypothetical protein
MNFLFDNLKNSDLLFGYTASSAMNLSIKKLTLQRLSKREVIYNGY